MANKKHTYIVTVAFDTAPHTRETATRTIEAWSVAEVKKFVQADFEKYFTNVKVLNVREQTLWEWAQA